MATGDKPGTTRLTIRNLTQVEHIAMEIKMKEAGFKYKDEWAKSILQKEIADVVKRLEQALKT